MTKLNLTVFVLLGVFCLVCTSPAQLTFAQSSVVPAQSTSAPSADLELAQRFVPVLYFHADEVYMPQPVDVVLGISRLRQSRKMWLDTNILNNLTSQDLFAISTDETFFLDQWFGDTGSSEYANYSFHRAIYESTISLDAGGPGPLVYAHVV